MNKEDLKQISLLLLFVLYLFFGIATGYATFSAAGEEGLSFVLTGLAMTLLFLIPVWYIGCHLMYKKNKDFFDNLFK